MREVLNPTYHLQNYGPVHLLDFERRRISFRT
jgi:hypothetical protein